MRIRFPYTFAQVRKAVINLAALGSEVLAANVLHGTALAAVTAVVAVAGIVAHWQVPNEPTVDAMRKLGAVFAASRSWNTATTPPPAGTPAHPAAMAIDPHDIPTPQAPPTPGQQGSLG